MAETIPLPSRTPVSRARQPSPAPQAAIGAASFDRAASAEGLPWRSAVGWLAAGMLVAVGAGYLSGPQRASRTLFGLPAITRAERAFLATKAVRDLGLGLVTAILLARRDPKAAGAALAVGVAGPALDGALLTAIRGPRAQLGVHWGAAALMGAAARALLTSGTRQTASARSAR